MNRESFLHLSVMLIAYKPVCGKRNVDEGKENDENEAKVGETTKTKSYCLRVFEPL